MNTYKMGNKITGIIRAYHRGKIGDIVMQYDNQPYTVLKDVQANITFDDTTKSATGARNTELYYNTQHIKQISISDVVLNDKIMNLIFNKSEIKLMSRVENYTSSNKKLYINAPTDKIYQVFIYNAQQSLVKAYGELDNLIVDVSTDGNYLVCYQYEGSNGYKLNANNNNYYTLDLIITGNKNDNTSNMDIHLEKCGLKVNSNMYFNNTSNTVDLMFTVIATDDDYITLE